MRLSAYPGETGHRFADKDMRQCVKLERVAEFAPPFVYSTPVSVKIFFASGDAR